MGAGPHMKGNIQGPRITCTENHRSDRQGTEGKEGRPEEGFGVMSGSLLLHLRRNLRSEELA